MSKRYSPVIAHHNARGTSLHYAAGKGPGREKAPFPQIQLINKQEEPATCNEVSRARKHSKKGGDFPEGLYVAVSRPEDFFIVQSSRPERVMLALTGKNAKYLLADNKPSLPFKPAEIILTLDPYFPQFATKFPAQSKNGTDNVAQDIKRLAEKGYLQYILNNPGHFSLFRDIRDKVKLIGGPWLYMFNSWSLSFIASLGVDGFVSPLENNRQNLERTLGIKSRGSETHGRKRHGFSPLHSKFFITVFAWPPLFNIRANISPGLASFADNKDEIFSLVTGHEGCRVYPQKPFSIIDKIPFLKEAGFGRFIIDLSGQLLKKSDYRDLMRSVKESAPLPHSSRFNWKDGFYQNQNTTAGSS
jgi:putative protease